MEIIHWDDTPFGTGFAVSQFEDGPYRGMWGIRASLPDGGLVWIALGSPPELVFALEKAMCQLVLSELRTELEMNKISKEIGDWGDGNPSGLPDPRVLPVVNWDEVPESVPLQERQLRGGLWWILALMPDGEHLVVLDRFVWDAGYRAFNLTQAEARRVIDWLKLVEPDPDPQVETRLRRVASTPPDFPPFGLDGPTSSDKPEGTDFYLLAALDRTAEADIRRIAELEEEWRRRLKAGKKSSCICGQCRHEIRRKVAEIMEWHDKPEVFESGESVSELFLDAYRLFDLLSQP